MKGAFDGTFLAHAAITQEGSNGLKPFAISGCVIERAQRNGCEYCGVCRGALSRIGSQSQFPTDGLEIRWLFT
jgi:hypothetical protein